jgi:hydrogenase expression/formation protein HypD
VNSQAQRVRESAGLIKRLDLPRKVRLMEVCGGHTAVIHRFALAQLLPAWIELLSGPGCPVCVTPIRYVDQAVALARQSDTTIATFGDLMRVPGSSGSLADARACGADIRVVYSAIDAVELAQAKPDRMIVLLGIGFETTACTIAASVEYAVAMGFKNFRLFSAMKTMPAAMRSLVNSGDVEIDGFILPGHVMTVTGVAPFNFLASEYRIPCAVSGFEPVDLMDSILLLCRQILEERAEIETQYHRSVRYSGNITAQRCMDDMFVPCDSEWRGLGVVHGSGLALRQKYFHVDAASLIHPLAESIEPAGCRCGEILRGRIRPSQCGLFSSVCTPETPYGACMVSSEGACASALQYMVEADAV